jgi:D-Tyr-tRNAtyr deacylase
VTVDGQLISSIGKGILVFAAVAKDDTDKTVESMAAKVLKFQMWDDEAGGRVRGPSTSLLVQLHHAGS